VNNSIWYWKWDSIEDWNKMLEGEKYGVGVYGVRIPVLGIFPNIVKNIPIYHYKNKNYGLQKDD
jgi:hypothetical protein